MTACMLCTGAVQAQEIGNHYVKEATTGVKVFLEDKEATYNGIEPYIATTGEVMVPLSTIEKLGGYIFHKPEYPKEYTMKLGKFTRHIRRVGEVNSNIGGQEKKFKSEVKDGHVYIDAECFKYFMYDRTYKDGNVYLSKKNLLAKHYSDFNNPVEAIKYINTVYEWELFDSEAPEHKGRFKSHLVQTVQEDGADILVDNDGAIVVMHARQWNSGGDMPQFCIAENINDMAAAEEILKFYLGDAEGEACYKAWDKSIINRRRITGKADNGMKIKTGANGAGFYIIITK